METMAFHAIHPGLILKVELEARGLTVPQSLEDLLRDYDIQKIRTLTHAFCADASAGKELI